MDERVDTLGSDELTSRKLNARDWAIWVKSTPASLSFGERAKGLGGWITAGMTALKLAA